MSFQINSIQFSVCLPMVSFKFETPIFLQLCEYLQKWGKLHCNEEWVALSVRIMRRVLQFKVVAKIQDGRQFHFFSFLLHVTNKQSKSFMPIYAFQKKKLNMLWSQFIFISLMFIFVMNPCCLTVELTNPTPSPLSLQIFPGIVCLLAQMASSPHQSFISAVEGAASIVRLAVATQNTTAYLATPASSSVTTMIALKPVKPVTTKVCMHS